MKRRDPISATMSNKMRYLWTAALVAAITLVGGPALAHPVPTAYSPGDGASVSSAPSEAWVEFDQTLQDGDLQVIDPCGQRVDDGDAQIFATRITVAISADTAGTYTAQWIAMGTDPHKVSGDWNFKVTGGDACPGSKPEDPQDGSDNGQPSDGDGDTNVSASGGSDDDDSTATGGNGGKNKNKNGNKHQHDRTKEGKDDPVVNDGGTTGPPARTAAAAAPSGDIPLDWLLISFGVAALIGAAAGQIYVNLVDPQDKG